LPLIKKGIRRHGYAYDVNNEEVVTYLIYQIKKDIGIIDVLINNAGIIKLIPMTEMSVADFRKVIDIDLNAPFYYFKGDDTRDDK
jgi:gluconate 5-dehydrogenase